VHHVQACQLVQPDDGLTVTHYPGREPDLGLELTQRHGVQRVGQQRRVRRQPAQGTVGLPQLDLREPGVQRAFQPRHVDAGRGGYRPQPDGYVGDELARQRGRHGETQPETVQAGRLPAAAHPVVQQRKHGARILEQRPAGRGELNAAALPVQQGSADDLLETADLLA
jgi:hypothetical protein